jgi:hypothetical protein
MCHLGQSHQIVDARSEVTRVATYVGLEELFQSQVQKKQPISQAPSLQQLLGY